MILFSLMALSLASTPEQGLRDEASRLGHYLAMGVVCGELRLTTLNPPALIAMGDDLFARAKPYGLSEQDLTDVSMAVANNFSEHIRNKYPAGTGAQFLSDMTAECQTLSEAHPDVFKPYQPQ